MNKEIIDHYLTFGVYTNPGCYKEYFQKLPDDIKTLGELICHQVVHRVILQNYNNTWDSRYGNLNEYPWFRLRCDDDVLTTTVSMTAELFRLDDRGFVKDRSVENKIIVTCRYVAILMASILKSKNIACRVRSGFAPYLTAGSWDHWINQYWNEEKQKWITFDADGFYNKFIGFDQYDMPEDKFDFSANVWLGIRNGKLDENNFNNAGGYKGIEPVLWELMYDFHCLMNNEILYLQCPRYIANKFKTLSENELKEIDKLAEILIDPDSNFNELKYIWENEKKFRILNSPLIDDVNHVKWS